MAWEWVAPAATGVGTVVSTLAVFVTARSGQKHAEQVSQSTTRAAERLAHQERAQKDRADAYVETLTLANSFTLWSERIAPVLDTIPPAEDPPLPSDADQVRVRALLGAHGSPEVTAAFEDLATAVKNINAAVRHLRRLQADRETAPTDTVSVNDAWNQLENTRPAQRHALDTLTERIATELRSLPPAPASPPNDA